MKAITKLINEYCDKHKTNIHTIEKEADMGNGVIGGWETNMPSTPSLIKLSQATKIPLAKLINAVQQDEVEE